MKSAGASASDLQRCDVEVIAKGVWIGAVHLAEVGALGVGSGKEHAAGPIQSVGDLGVAGKLAKFFVR